MAFWNVVIDELEYQGKTRKWLAKEAKIDISTIGTGLKRQSMPQVDLAIRVANALKVPVEYLTTGKIPSLENPLKNEDLHLFHKYSKIINNLDSLSDREKTSVINLIDNLAEKTT